jgi:hypothetical protein
MEKPRDLRPSPSPVKSRPSAAPRVPASGPFSLATLSISRYVYPEDFSLGPLEARSDRPPKEDPSSLAYAFLSALVKKSDLSSFYAADRADLMNQALKPYLSGEGALSSFRLGRLRLSGDSAEAMVYLFADNGARALSELFLSKSSSGWAVDGMAVDFRSLFTSKAPAPTSFEPGQYSLFSP